MIRLSTWRVVVVGMVVFPALPACAMERVTLKTGFAIECARHEDAANGLVKLVYAAATPGGREGEQIVRLADIESIEVLPDPPKVEAVKVEPVTVSAAPAKSVRAGVVPSSDLQGMLAKAGKEFAIDADLLAAVVKAESGGRVDAVSRTGARGLMQLMPGTANAMGVKDSFEADQNIHGGTAYLNDLLKKYYDPKAHNFGLDLVLAAYNAGPGAVAKYHGVPPYRETINYVARVEREYNRLVKARETAASATAVGAH